jgi:hypothetical protein
MSTPKLESAELMKRLESANRKRSELAKLRRDIKNGKIEITDVLRDPPECALGTSYTGLLKCVPGLGPRKLDVLMKISGMPDRNITPKARSNERELMIRLIERWQRGELSLRSGKRI